MHIVIISLHIINIYLLIKILLNMQQTNLMYLQSEIKVTKGNGVHIARSRENNGTEEPCIPVSHYKSYILFIVMHVVKSSFKLHALQTEKTILSTIF